MNCHVDKIPPELPVLVWTNFVVRNHSGTVDLVGDFAIVDSAETVRLLTIVINLTFKKKIEKSPSLGCWNVARK